MHPKSSISLLVCFMALVSSVSCAYPPNFYNQSDCLYVYMDLPNSNYNIALEDAERQQGSLKSVDYEGSSCAPGEKNALLVMSFPTQDNNMHRMILTFKIEIVPAKGYWAVTDANLKISPANPDLFPPDFIKDGVPMVQDISAGGQFSYSCNRLDLHNPYTGKNIPSIKLTLRQFQIQPFKQNDRTVFAPSFDCSVYFSLPLLMGFLLVMFIISTVVIGVYLLMEQGNQTSDLKFSKQGGMLMNQAQLDATKD